MLLGRLLAFIPVAPFAGAWIEIDLIEEIEEDIASHPSRVRGLKYIKFISRDGSINVAPFAGAWIEIISSIKSE